MAVQNWIPVLKARKPRKESSYVCNRSWRSRLNSGAMSAASRGRKSATCLKPDETIPRTEAVRVDFNSFRGRGERRNVLPKLRLSETGPGRLEPVGEQESGN